MSMILIGKLFGLALLAVAVAPGLRAAAAADDGRSTFDKRCAACHDVKG